MHILARSQNSIEHTLAASVMMDGPVRPPIWADVLDDPRNGLRVIGPWWLDGEAGWAQRPAPSASSRRLRCEPDPSTDAAWMHPAQPRPPPKRARLESFSAAVPQHPQQ